jgi:hypothetical protein
MDFFGRLGTFRRPWSYSFLAFHCGKVENWWCNQASRNFSRMSWKGRFDKTWDWWTWNVNGRLYELRDRLWNVGDFDGSVNKAMKVLWRHAEEYRWTWRKENLHPIFSVCRQLSIQVCMGILLGICLHYLYCICLQI